MERKDLIAKNAQIFSEQGKILDKVAKKDVKVTLTFRLPKIQLSFPFLIPFSFLFSFWFLFSIPQ